MTQVLVACDRCDEQFEHRDDVRTIGITERPIRVGAIQSTVVGDEWVDAKSADLCESCAADLAATLTSFLDEKDQR